MDFEQMSDEDLRDVRAQIADELRSRDRVGRMPEVMDEMLRQRGRAAGRPGKGEPWVPPSGGHDAYPMGSKVTSGGRLWISMAHSNTDPPGVSGWREVTDDDAAPPEWAQPAGAHDAYAAGDRVSFDETEVWMSVVDSNTWEPKVYGWERER